MNIKYMMLSVAALAAVSAQGQRLSDGKTRIDHAQLQRQDGSMVLRMDVLMDSLRLDHRRSVAIRPVLVSPDGQHQAAFEPLVIDSRAQHVLYRRGQSIPAYRDARHVRRQGRSAQTEYYSSTIAYEPWMRSYDLQLQEDLCGCGDLEQLPYVPALSKRLEPKAVPALNIPLSPDDYKKLRQLEGRAYIDFRVNKIDLDPSYRRNPEELRKILATIDEVRGKKDVEISRVTIHGYASPEGTYQHNTWLAQNRAATLRDHIQRLYRFPQGVIGSASTPEDWAGLRQYVAQSQMAERDDILRIIDSDMDFDAKDAQIKRQYPERYKQLLADVYPGLRHSDYLIEYSIRPYTLAESHEVYRTHPEDLSLSELMALAGEAGTDTEAGRAIIYRAAELLPQNPRATLLAAQAAIAAGDYARAERILPATAQTPEQAYLLGGIRKMQQRYDEARTLMQQAQRGGIAEATAQLAEINELLGE